jgi:hypothetical protein
MRDGVDLTMRLVDKDMDVAIRSPLEKMTQAPFGKFIPVMNLEQNGVAYSHDASYPLSILNLCR